MRTDAAGDAATGLGIGALELFVEVLSQSEAGSTADDFYDRLCEAVCRLARMRRAIIFRYDSGQPAGPRGRRAWAELDQFASAHVTVESAPITAPGAGEDRVVEVTGDVRGQSPTSSPRSSPSRCGWSARRWPPPAARSA